jgi:hypothetical protein
MADQGGQGPSMSQNVNGQPSEMSQIANGHPGQGHPGHAHIRQPQPQTAQRQRPPVLGAVTIGVPGENPAIDLESTDGSGNGSPVDAPSEPQQVARLDSSPGDFLAQTPTPMAGSPRVPIWLRSEVSFRGYCSLLTETCSQDS